MKDDTLDLVKFSQLKRRLRESALACPVMDWLAERGFTCYGEVPSCNRTIDIVAIGDTVEVVELKLCLSRVVILQAARNQFTSHRSSMQTAMRLVRRKRDHRGHRGVYE